MKKLLVAVALVMFAFSANAQLKIGVGGGVALPMGDFGDGFKMGFGGGVAGKYMLNEKLALGLNLGYYSFTAKDEAGGSDVKFSVMPITALVNYYFATEGFKPYVGADLGFYACKSKVSVLGMDVSATATKLGFAPTLGFEYGFSDKMGLDVNAKYHYITTEGSSTSYVGINLGLVFTLGGK